jgi:hypothetical protein
MADGLFIFAGVSHALATAWSSPIPSRQGFMAFLNRPILSNWLDSIVIDDDDEHDPYEDGDDGR